ncbi:chemotaxis response regulator protein-glutamate methylesterase [Caenibius tardaugens NBRC 16725]|uniref:Protein-glutamate methylesterase/protein-glutamine glutaminase n=1 Tax=Caenibius tardaugens NBRC 16725 TaxID=1219035 RepID=U2YJJ9_9SPHN|nr:chemotaxis-specific protein-glutamate methyltransferase CheB [Caenibius tardaugens]AZI36262.1 chemotaxis-specific protein-glutamate methyltransferase CheB [Caenibius tardaugens NBRC 16725]GAD48625.1 chemotaxis response regulator protein-glutamate methylesterase [Caenibius tardaugens NBRC 16725]
MRNNSAPLPAATAAEDFSRTRAASRPGVNAIRVMVVDDSITARTVYARIIEKERDLELSAVAGTAEDALAALRTMRVDVILLDLEMPGMGGLKALPRLIAAARGAQIIVVSALTLAGAEHTVQALALGAADALPKPPPGRFDQDYRNGLVAKIRGIARTRRVLRQQAEASPRAPSPFARQPGHLRGIGQPRAHVLAIGASTGGIHALGRLFASLPPQIGVPILVTQHLPGSFTEIFARQLEMLSGRTAVVAEDRLALLPNRIVVAPGDAHMTVVPVRGGHQVRLDREPAASGFCPSVDPFFASVAQAFGANALGVMLSGMGRDGCAGAGQIAAAGGVILAQDEESCAVWGMPGAVAQAGIASAILPPEGLAGRIVLAVGGQAWS